MPSGEIRKRLKDSKTKFSNRNVSKEKKDVILIVTEREVTEVEYFESFNLP